MVNVKKTFFIIFYFYFFPDASGQDIHFSQFNAAPLLLNPANTGDFNGNLRAGGIYRNQWRSFLPEPFVTYSVFADKPVRIVLTKNDYLSAGLTAYKDRAGTAQFSTTAGYLSVSYHRVLGKFLAGLGLQGGLVQKSINKDDLTFAKQFQGIFYSSELSSGETYTAEPFSYFDLHAGAGCTYRHNEKFSFSGGVTLYHLNTPRETYFNVSDNELGKRFMFNGGATYRITDPLVVHPGFLYNGQSRDRNILFGTDGGYTLLDLPLREIEALFGLWYRRADALIVVPGLRYNQYRFAMSYDINLSSLSKVSKSRGAFEFSFIYITGQKLSMKTTIPCKRL